MPLSGFFSFLYFAILTVKNRLKLFCNLCHCAITEEEEDEEKEELYLKN